MIVYIPSALVLKTHKRLFICFVLFAEQTAIIPCTAMTDGSLQWECECYCDARNEFLDSLIHSLVFSLRGRAGRNNSPVM